MHYFTIVRKSDGVENAQSWIYHIDERIAGCRCRVELKALTTKAWHVDKNVVSHVIKNIKLYLK